MVLLAVAASAVVHSTDLARPYAFFFQASSLLKIWARSASKAAKAFANAPCKVENSRVRVVANLFGAAVPPHRVSWHPPSPWPSPGVTD
jgi:hypothetical protein